MTDLVWDLGWEKTRGNHWEFASALEWGGACGISVTYSAFFLHIHGISLMQLLRNKYDFWKFVDTDQIWITGKVEGCKNCKKIGKKKTFTKISDFLRLYRVLKVYADSMAKKNLRHFAPEKWPNLSPQIQQKRPIFWRYKICISKVWTLKNPPPHVDIFPHESYMFISICFQ